MIRLLTLALFIAGSYHLIAPVHADWPMVGANPQRTSWVSEGVSGKLSPLWYRNLDAYIPRKNQLIIANNTIYLSTAKGLYALNVTDGSQKWLYPTALPLGNSPTLSNNILYVGGHDGHIYAIMADTGQLKPGWQLHQANSGYATNPLVVNNTVYAGNRDGYFYALDAQTGNLKWRYQTGGPIQFSAALSSDSSKIYFASNDSYAYALNASTGSLIWKSTKLIGDGFQSWWPVVYTEPTSLQEYVIFPGSNNYRVSIAGYDGDLGNENFVTTQELYDLFTASERSQSETSTVLIGPLGSIANNGYWPSGSSTIDNNRTVQYLETNPHKRTYFVLNAQTGQEYTFDSDNDSKPEYAPFSWAGITHSGNRYPPMVVNHVLYQTTMTKANPYIARDSLVGWKFGTPYISTPISTFQAVDEPQVCSAGGNILYLNVCCDRQVISADVSSPNSSFPSMSNSREWIWFGWNLWDILPGYNDGYYDENGTALFGSVNGVYGDHGVQNPPIPYNNRVYVHYGNSIVAFSASTTSPIHYPSIPAPSPTLPQSSQTADQLKAKLLTEVTNILDAPGLLRTGYYHTGLFDGHGGNLIGPNLSDYFHNPSDTIITLLRTLPFLPESVQTQVQNYLKRWQCVFPMQTIAHIGYKSSSYNVTCNGVNYTGNYGTPREAFTIPPEIAAQMANFGPLTSEDPTGWNNLPYWRFPPLAFYGMWKYSLAFGNTLANFNAIKSKLPTPPSDSVLIQRPYIHNAFLGGYLGYLELEKLAGLSETTTVRNQYNRLLSLRLTNFSANTPWTTIDLNNYSQALNIAGNYMYLVPEIAVLLRADPNVASKVQTQISEIDQIAPYWFVSKYDSTRYEGVLQPLYDYHSIFLAKALLLDAPQTVLAAYLDTPAFERGDLFYIDNLVTALEAYPDLVSPTPNPPPSTDHDLDGDTDFLDLRYVVINFNSLFNIFDFNALVGNL